jgi:putative transposase
MKCYTRGILVQRAKSKRTDCVHAHNAPRHLARTSAIAQFETTGPAWLMARWPRVVVPNVPMHIVQRGNNRTETFHAREDFEYYREVLIDATERTGCLVHSYVLMTNHVHLLLTPPDHIAASRLIQIVGRRYVRYFNARYGRTGTLWEGRFKSSLIDSTSYFLTCSRYIDLNPLRAGMVDVPIDYRWSSYRRLAVGAADSVVTPHPLYSALGATPAERQRTYAGLCASELPSPALKSIRVALRGGSALGMPRFRTDLEVATRRSVTRLPHGGDRRSASFQEL